MIAAQVLTSSAAGRNRDPILAVLRSALPAAGLVLEVASGSGEHAVWFSAAFPSLDWQPTDRDPAALASIAERRTVEGGPKLRSPIALDAAHPDWPVSAADAVVAINMIHITPWKSTEGLVAGAGRILPNGGPLVLYGPFREAGIALAPSNAAFDDDLRFRDPRWGLRDLEAVAACAARHGLLLEQRTAMPANNLAVVFRRA